MRVERIQFGGRWILECAQHLQKKRSAESMALREKEGCSDIVTDHDLWVQEDLIRNVSRCFPRDQVIGEEETKLLAPHEGEWQWLVDPIDGTGNYAYLGREYSICLALLHWGNPYYGWVYDVTSQILYDSQGMHGVRISGPERTEHCLLYMGYKTMKDLTQEGVDPYTVCGQFAGVRYEGCASLEICRILREPARVYLSSHLKSWDFAAAACVLKSAGAVIRAVPIGNDRYYVYACKNKKVAESCEQMMPIRLQGKLRDVDAAFCFETGKEETNG